MDQQVTTADPAEAAKYDALRKTLGIEPEADGGEQQEPVVEPAEQQEPQSEPEQQPAEKPKPSYEELEDWQRKTSGALKEAKERASAAEAREQAIVRLIRETQAQRQPAAEVKKDEPPKIPDKLEDPIAHYDARIAQLEQQLTQAHQGTQQNLQQVQDWQRLQAMKTYAEQAETEYAKEKPDYWDACKHLEGMRLAQLDEMYPSDHPQVMHIAQQQGFRTPAEWKVSLLDQDRAQVLQNSIQMGISPAVLYYNLALRTGYQAKPKELPAPSRGKQQIEAIQRGQKAAVSISGGNNGRKGAENMSQTELIAFFDEDPDAAMAIMRKMGEQGLLG